LLVSDTPLERIVVLRALQLGDLLCSVPALRALRAAQPRARITLIGLPWSREFVARFPDYLDELIELPGFPGLPEREPRVTAIPSFLAEVQQRRFDLAIQMQGNGSLTNPLLALFGARRMAGFVVPGQYCPDAATFVPYLDGEHEVRRHLRLMAALGAPSQDATLEFPLTAEDFETLARLDGMSELRPGGYVCVHPGARWPSRRWPVERFATVADALAARGWRIVLTGSGHERRLTAALAERLRDRPVDLCGRTSLGAFAALLAGAGLLICNDTGVSHVAAALQVPSVVVFSGSSPMQWAPLDRTRHRVVSHPLACKPCGHRRCPFGQPCALLATPDQVLEQAEALLGGGARPGPSVGAAARSAPRSPGVAGMGARRFDGDDPRAS